MKQILYLAFVLSLLGFIFGCPPKKPPQGSPATGKVFEPAEEPGQIPQPVLESASRRYGGAFQAEPALQPAVTQSEGQGGVSVDPGSGAPPPAEESRATRLSVVLGPVSFETPLRSEQDAGQRIREVISQELQSMENMTLLDAPEERFKNDSPRPDLAAKGVRFVIKGTSSFNPESGNTTVFLRIVATDSGEVYGVTSGRGKNEDDAAKETTARLIRKLERAR